MKRTFIFSIALIASFFVAPSVAYADQNLPAFDMCSSESSTGCIYAFSVKGPADTEFRSLGKSGYTDQGISFDTAPSGHAPSNGNNLLVLQAHGIVLPNSATDRILSNLDLTSQDSRGNVSGLAVDDTYQIIINLDSEFPGSATALLEKGSYRIEKLEKIYRLTIESKPLAKLASGVGPCNCPSLVAQSEQIGVFSLIFGPQFWVPGMSDIWNLSQPKAWYASESNSMNNTDRPWITGGQINFRLSGPHFMMDGVTLNDGRYRLVVNNAFVENLIQITREQALTGGIATATGEVGNPTVAIGSTVSVLNSEQLEIVLAPFHYSTRDVVVGSSQTFKTSTVTWSGKKSSVKRNKALAVNTSVKSNKKKAAGTMRVDLVNSAGVVVGSLNSNVKKGSGKVTFSKAFTKQLAPGKYTVKINYFGSGAAKNSNRSYSLKVK